MKQYTVSQLARLSGVTARTIRYYAEIGILLPATISANDYRIYTKHEVDRLQQILYYRRLGFKLTDIKEMMNQPNYDVVAALKKQQENLRNEVENTNLLIKSLEKAINYYQGGQKLTDQEKFQELKRSIQEDNELKYGPEIRKKYGPQQVQLSNEAWTKMSKDQFEASREIEKKLAASLKAVGEVDEFDVNSQLAKDVFIYHRRWLQLIYPNYTREYHRYLADIYKNDNRFAQYYNNLSHNEVVNRFVKIIKHYT